MATGRVLVAPAPVNRRVSRLRRPAATAVHRVYCRAEATGAILEPVAGALAAGRVRPADVLEGDPRRRRPAAAVVCPAWPCRRRAPDVRAVLRDHLGRGN